MNVRAIFVIRFTWCDGSIHRLRFADHIRRMRDVWFWRLLEHTVHPCNIYASGRSSRLSA